jgi:hypothetical protein
MRSALSNSAAPDWPVGSVIYRGGDEGNLRVVQVIDAEVTTDLPLLVVELAG